jgi:hypothetical protein
MFTGYNCVLQGELTNVKYLPFLFKHLLQSFSYKDVFLCKLFFMNIISSHDIESIYRTHKESSLFGRWITLKHIQKTFHQYQTNRIQHQPIGSSEQDRPIYEFKTGNGSKKILIWTQMHGNESTGTKAVFDLLHYLNNADDPIYKSILKECHLKIIPILNPDGAIAYTRSNAKNVDLNRDAVKRIAKESKLLRSVLEDFQPDFCFNMHDQRTIFGVSGTENPATISFLAPSEEVTRSLTETRKRTMNVIVAMNTLLQRMIPGHVGRYTDEFYPKATGDNFQKLGFPTILIESGHYPDDYEREETRKYTFVSLLQGIYHIATNSDFQTYEDYFNIPDNEQSFKDLIHRYKNKKDEVFQYEEVLEDETIKFVPIRVKGDTSDLLFHKEIVFVD